MFYVYILRCSDGLLYIGFTSDLRKRIGRHNAGYVKATKPRLPVELIFYEAYRNKYDALRRERYFKTTKGKRTIKTMLDEDLTSSSPPIGIY